MQNNPLISIIIPVYNIEKYLPQCLDSVVGQTYENLEIICVNDQSPDGSLDILKDYAERDSRIKIIDKQNEGVSVARNQAIQNAHGEYIMFIDGDDWIDIQTCEEALKIARCRNADVVLFSYVREFQEISSPKTIFKENEIIFDKEGCRNLCRRMAGPYGDELATPENMDALCTIWGKLYRSDIIKSNNISFYDIREIGTYEDGIFNLNLFHHIEKAVFLNQHFYHYRKTNTTSITSRYKENLLAQWQKLFDIIEIFAKENLCGDDFLIALNNRIALSIIGQGFNILESDKSARFKIIKIKEILKLPRYRAAYKALDYKCFPLHWKLLFRFAKMRCATLVYLMLLAAAKLKNK